MHLSEIVIQNLLSPAVLFFVLGSLAGLIKSDLDIPDSISSYLSIYLMMAIGFKGGNSIAEASINLQGWLLIGIGVLISFLQPFLSYALLRLTTQLNQPTAAAVAAHYGSISMVTFVTASAFLKSKGVSYDGYIIGILALMEAPAILSGLYIAHRTTPSTRTHKKEEKRLCSEIFTNGAILLLSGSFFIGYLTGPTGMEKVKAFLVDPFQGVLCLFLLDMGLLVSKNIKQLKKIKISVFLFGLYMPIIGASIGLFTSYYVGVGLGTSVLFSVLCASASYIAVPAAMRLALPEAEAAVYVPLSLALTFPFNVALGIPLIYVLACMIHG